MDVSIVGASGYAGGELLRILTFHSRVRIRQATSRRFVGQPVSFVHPNLRGRTGLKFSDPEELEPCDVLFLALPNGESMRRVEVWKERASRIVDLGADFRLKRLEDWVFWYGTDHAAPHLLGEFVYGLPELRADEIRRARFVAGPGCEAAVSILCLYPVLKHGLIRKGPVVIDAKMGSSQTGHSFSASSHHPERAGAVRSYKPAGHRHAAEIEQELKEVGPGISALISATAVEMVRGILVTIHAFLEPDVQEGDVWEALRKEYRDKPFVRLVKQRAGLYRFPEPKILQGTNYCDIGFEIDRRGRRLVVIGAIDNLGKGTAGNAVQCLNLMADFPETAGLECPGLHPV